MKRRKKTEVLNLKQVKEILRLGLELGLNQTQISRSCNVSRSTVQDYLCRAKAAGLNLEELEFLSEQALIERLGKLRGRKRKHSELDYQKIERELCKPGVTKALLWQEYVEQNPGGHCYSSFCTALRQWKKNNRLSMRQQHKSGEKLYVDYAGHTVPIYSRERDEIIFHAQIFVAVLGASNYTFAEATASQELKHWLGSHVRCFAFLGGVPEAVVPDNLKSAVTRANFYDPLLNPRYLELAEHYEVAVLPARKGKPKDKAKVEVGVQIVERWILAAFRNRRFYSLAELNQEISRLLEKINTRKMRTYGCSRKEMFELVDKPALSELPAKAYQFFEYKLARVNIDYHVEVEQHYYSVPYQLRQKEVEIRIREQVIEVLHGAERVTTHLRSREKFRHSTKKEHLPPSHQTALKWPPSRLVNWAATIGPQTKAQVESLLNSRQHPEQSYRACLGLLRLGKKLGATRLEAACARANHFGIASYKKVKSILDTNMDRLPIVETKEIPVVRHRNLRGGDYYH